MEYIIFAVGVLVTFMVCGGLFFSGFRQTSEQPSAPTRKIAKTEI